MASDTQRKTILLKGDFDGNHAVEGQATSKIIPGHLIDYDGAQNRLRTYNGAANKVAIARMFAVENDVTGNYPPQAGTTAGTLSIDVPYPEGERAYGYHCQAGDIINALVDAGAAAIVFGDLLESAGDGSLVKRAAGTALARALEALDNSGGSNPARLKVEIL